MTKQYDIIIVGSGMGGLAAAVILAKEGYHVCVIEKNNQYGGNLQTFVRDKTIFDTGVHYLGSLAKGQNLYQYFNYLGILPELQLEQMDKTGYDHISFGDHKQVFLHPQGYPQFIEQLSTYFPDERRNIEKYCFDIQNICKHFPLYNLSNQAIYDTSIFRLNLKDYLNQLTTNKTLKSVLVGSNILYAGHKNTPFYVHALTINSYIKSAWKCVKGGSQISKALVKQLRKYKADIFKKKEVNRFLYKEKKLIGVETTQNERFYAQKVIANIDLETTFRLAGREKFRKSFIKRVESLPLTPSSFSVHLVLKPNTFPYLNHNIYHYASQNDVWNASEYTEKDWPKLFMLSMGISSPHQEFAESLSLLTYMNFEEITPWKDTYNTVVNPQRRCLAYEKFKEQKSEQLINAAEKLFPNLRSCIYSIHASTPLSYRDYIGGKKGNMYGFTMDSSQIMRTHFSPKTKIQDLYLTGQNISMHGILGVTIGAFNTCAEIIGREKLMTQVNLEIKENERT